MNRALNVDLAIASVEATCVEMGLRISAIEPLISGGTRVVCASTIDSISLRKRLKANIIEGAVQRSPLALRSGRF